MPAEEPSTASKGDLRESEGEVEQPAAASLATVKECGDSGLGAQTWAA